MCQSHKGCSHKGHVQNLHTVKRESALAQWAVGAFMGVGLAVIIYWGITLSYVGRV